MKTKIGRPGTILFPTDLSPHSKSAAALVSFFVNRFQSRVIVLHVLPPVENPFELLSGGFTETRAVQDVASAQVREFITREFPPFPCDLRVEVGEPAEAIVRVANEVGVDLICLPTRGHGPFRRFLLGSISSKVLNDASVPVLTGAHMDNPGADAVRDIRTVVCALSLDDRGERALRAALQVCEEFGARLVVAHALEDKTGTGRANADHAIASLMAGASVPFEVVVGDGDPAPFVRTVAAEKHADMVVIGRSAPGPLGRLRTQSYAIVRESPCPVLSV
ncbi:MAG: universal stress protein [Bryobacteraceae bacterium]|mgnify:CR=1 FL=1|nr:universal stress protein [Bryobacteraceae bacterium]